jgi:hypothetical protein
MGREPQTYAGLVGSKEGVDESYVICCPSLREDFEREEGGFWGHAGEPVRLASDDARDVGSVALYVHRIIIWLLLTLIRPGYSGPLETNIRVVQSVEKEYSQPSPTKSYP